jgi:long-chain acyl-CoA synthetase
VPLYDTLGDEAVQYVISHSEVRVVVVSAAKAPALTKILGAMGSAGAHQTQVASVVVWGPHGEEVLKVRDWGGWAG